MLLIIALSRLGGVNLNPWLLVAIGIVAGLLKSRFVLGVVAEKNLQRIRELLPHKEKICIFAFQANLSYLLIGLMMAMGMILRRLELPADLIVPLYIMIGTALMHAGLKYINAKVS